MKKTSISVRFRVPLQAARPVGTLAAGILLGSSLMLGCAVHAGATVNAQPPPPPPASVDVQAQVDAQPGTTEVEVAPAPEATAEPEEVTATSEPPELVYEEQTDMPNQGMIWVPGYWQWSGADWAWYYGGWNAAPEGHVYFEPYYERVDDHVVYVRGYWGIRGEEPRYYGGDRIVFSAPARPDGYVRGQHVVIGRSVGLRPGQRGHYGPKPTGPVKRRSLPTASAPRRPVGHPGGHAEAPHAEGHAEARTTTETKEVKPEARPEARPEPRPGPKPAPTPVHPRPRKK